MLQQSCCYNYICYWKKVFYILQFREIRYICKSETSFGASLKKIEKFNGWRDTVKGKLKEVT